MEIKRGKEKITFSLNKHPVIPATFAHWLKQVLKEAGVSEDFLPIIPTRATAVSVAFDKGISLADIIRTANWSSD